MTLLLHSQAFVYITLDIIRTTVTIKNVAPHATSYLWQCRYNDIYTKVDLSMNVIKTLYIAHHDNAHNNQILTVPLGIEDGL